MDKAMTMGKVSATGSFHLFIGKIASTLMLTIGSIIVGIFIDPGEYGLYTIVLVPAMTLLLFQDWGIGSALTKYCANYRAEKREGELRNIIVTGLTFEAITGLVLTLISLLTANFFATTIFNNPDSTFLITLVSITIFSAAINAGSISIFTGFERMELITITMIVSATMQGLISALLVYFGFGAVGALLGFIFGSVVSSGTAVTLLYFNIFRRLPLGANNESKIFQTLKPLLRYGLPLSIGLIIGGVLPQVINFVMASSTDVLLIGNFGIAKNFAVFLSFFTLPINVVLFPAFSKLDPSREKQLLKTIFASSVKYSSLFLVPSTIALMILSAPLIGTLFGEKWLFAPLFLTVLVIVELFVLFGGMSFGRLLVATGETKFLMKLNVLTLCTGVPLAFLLIPPFGIIGVIFTGIVAGTPSCIIGIYGTWKRFETKADFRNSARIFFASALAGVTTHLFLYVFVAAPWIMLTTGVMIFLFVYIVSIILFGAINQKDISNLQVMFSGLGPISKILQILLTLLEKSFKVKEKYSKIRK